MSELPDKFEAVDPVTGISIRFTVAKEGHYERKTKHTRAHLSGSCTRALIQYGRDLERADPTPKEQTKEERLRSQEGSLEAMLRDLPKGSLIERYGLTARLCSVRLEIESFQGKKADKELLDQLKELG